MSLKIIFGKNKSGKTKYLNEKYSNEDDYVLFLPAEINLITTIKKGNWGTEKNPNYAPQTKIVKFLNEVIIGNIYKKKINKKEKNRLNKFKEIIDNFNKKKFTW